MSYTSETPSFHLICYFASNLLSSLYGKRQKLVKCETDKTRSPLLSFSYSLPYFISSHLCTDQQKNETMNLKLEIASY